MLLLHGTPHTDRNINKLEKVQRRAARFVCNRYNNTSSVSDMIKHLQWPSLQQRRDILRLVLLYNIHHKLVHFDTSSYLTPTHGKAHHIHAQGYQIPFSRRDYHLYAFFPRTARTWNVLPPDVYNAPSVEAYRHRLAIWLAA